MATPQIIKTPLPQTARIWAQMTPGDFIDGYAVHSALSPRQAMEVGLSMPNWAAALLRLRNRLVAPLGLKTEVSDSGSDALFPILHDSEDELILGTDDSHLNFRITFLRRDGRLHMGTWVHRNNWLGRVYLAVVMPFHVLIVRDSLRRIARHAPNSSAIASQPPAQ
ncbi:DUF2867 domain-containing protein [Phaeobacter sp.]|uniref:DUF2867 domain-containing protein n=1 Tax=Phaeobacter sp. TaxID=1902409 RepID=UPI0025F2FBD9|nr:DUF2867 domain-containing protein [Phaeobacter sp.]